MTKKKLLALDWFAKEFKENRSSVIGEMAKVAGVTPKQAEAWSGEKLYKSMELNWRKSGLKSKEQVANYMNEVLDCGRSFRNSLWHKLRMDYIKNNIMDFGNGDLTFSGRYIVLNRTAEQVERDKEVTEAKVKTAVAKMGEDLMRLLNEVKGK